MVIPDPTTTVKKRAKKFVVFPIFVAMNFTKLEIVLFLNKCRTIWANLQGIKVFTRISLPRSQKYELEIRDPRPKFDKNLSRIPDPYPGVKKAPDPRSRDSDPHHSE
jgi:hypothetical protein